MTTQSIVISAPEDYGSISTALVALGALVPTAYEQVLTEYMITGQLSVTHSWNSGNTSITINRTWQDDAYTAYSSSKASNISSFSTILNNAGWSVVSSSVS